ncbi:OpgC domain-containing protein [Bradyrhizobium sp. ARR65]|uniref:OpgC domain-containing protein n=1 Tax=Bradyrhizobium sp. ARR65 TaxID=1040989 RepID=UPI0009FE44ED|nr:OpgC domain-containing protein [Bradyrhizobium sp. ARR65]
MGLIEVVTDRPQSPRKFPVVRYDHDHRDLRLDACRGLALWFIFIDHIPDNALSWLTLRNYGFSDASEVFVFVSGYTCMLAYGGAFCEQGWRTIAVRALRRAWEIYAAFLLLVLFYVALVWIIGNGQRFVDDTNTGFFFRQPGPAIAHTIGLQFAPVDTDILLTFVILHAIFPGLFWILIHGPRLTLALSLLLYLMVQMFDWHVPAWPSGEIYFNPLAWQFLFVIGAWYSFENAAHLRPIIRSRTVFLLAVAYLACSLIVALSWQFKSLEWFIPEQVAKLIYPIDKSHLAPLRLLHFLSLALVVSRLTPPEWHGLIRPLMIAMIRCGENSLSIYGLGVLLAFIARVILVDVSSTFAMQLAVSLAGIAIMIVAATVLTWESRIDRRGPKLF